MMHETNHIGIRVLTKDMMECSFSHTTAVMATIEKIRKTAYEVHDRFLDTLKKNPDQGMMEARGYNNAISILGSRGAGKTSVIMTLQHILKYGRESWEKQQYGDEHSENILMPILVPQDFSAGQSLLSWVIMQLIQKGEEIEKIITTEKLCSYGRTGAFVRWEDDKCRYPAYDPLRECMDKLTTSFELRYKKDSKYDVSNSEHVYEYMDEVRRDARLVLDMLKLISMIIDFYRYQRSKKVYENEVEQEPLLFFVIDDLDLAPERSQEVLNLVLRYLQHPNVVVICGWNQELFQSHLCMELLKTQGSLDSKLLDTNFGYDDVFMSRQRKRVAALDSARRLAMDNLKKAFPPALRYEIRSLSTEQRAWFPKKPDDSKLLVKTEDCFLNIIRDTLIKCRRISDPESPQDVDFLINDDGYILAYMRIFDNKARGMVNAYFAFQMLQQSIDQWDKHNKLDITADLVNLIDALLFSNTHFVPYRRGLRDLIKIDAVILQRDKKKNVCEYYCNFKAVEKVLNEFDKDLNLVSDGLSSDRLLSDKMFYVERQYNYFPSLIIDVYILLNFIQNMLHFICDKPRYEHGGIEFSRALNRINQPIRISPNPDNALSCLIALSGLTKIDLFPKTEDFRFNLVLLDAYEKHRFSDCQYEFAGSHSYCRLSRALKTLIGTCYIENNEGSSRMILSKDGLEKFRQHDVKWMRSMESLFSSLRYSEENVSKLARYRSMLLQHNSLIELDSWWPNNNTIAKSIDVKKWKKTNKGQPVTMEILKEVAYAIRSISNFKREWIRYNNAKEQRLQTEEQQTTHVRQMRYFIELFDRNRAIEIKKYRNKIDTYRYNVAHQKYSESLSKDLIVAAHECADKNISYLLSYLQTNIRHACYLAYQKREDIHERFEFLVQVSKKIEEILRELNLGHGVWTAEDNKAAIELMEIFGLHDASEPYDLAMQLLEMGPKLEETKRDIYVRRLKRLKQWVYTNYDLFTAKEISRMELSMDVLQLAYQRIHRNMPAEIQLQEVFVRFGNEVADLCAQLSIQPSMLEDNTELNHRHVAWPVVIANRNEFDIWSEVSIDRELFS